MSAKAPGPFTWELPDGARVVVLVRERSEAMRSATVVDAIATSIARRRGPTLVVNVEPGPSPLDELAGAPETADSGGMAEFLAGRAGLARVAVRRADRPYAYLPAGQIPEGVAGLLESAAFERFVTGVKEHGGTLFLVTFESGRPAPGLLPLIDGYIALGALSSEDYNEKPCYGRIPLESSVDSDPEPPESAADGPPEPRPRPEPAEETSPAGSAPGKTRARRPRCRIVGAMLVIATLLAGGWWAHGNGWLDGAISRFEAMVAARQEGPAASATPDESGEQIPPAAEPDAPTARPEAAAQTPDPPAPDEASLADAFESASERPYSVLVASFRDPADAAARVAEIRALHAGMLYFTAPTMIREVPYHRILAGAAADEMEASVLMEELVAAGAAEETSAWLLRPVRFAYDLGAFADRPRMDARIAELASADIPAYSLGTALDGMPVFRVYVGAYESEDAAAPMGDVLEAAGESATLIVRRGDATSSTP